MPAEIVSKFACSPNQASSYELGATLSKYECTYAYIQFHPCGMRSYHPEDIRHRYCARCGRFIERRYVRVIPGGKDGDHQEGSK